MTLHKNLIDGEWVGGEAIPNISPSDTNDVVGEYARASQADALNAIAAAKAAFPAWSRSGIMERHAILRKTSDEILARKEELGRLLAREEGKTLPEAIGETMRAAQIFDFLPMKRCALPVKFCHPCARISVWKSPANQLVWSVLLPVEFPDCYSGMEDCTSSLLQEHRGVQTG